jgi:hypothetical protein
MARQAIRQLIQELTEGRGEDIYIYRLLVDTRDHLLHGRSPDSVEAVIGRPLEQIVNDAAAAAWNAIMFLLPKLEEPVAFGHRNGDFAHRDLVVTPDMTFKYEGDAEHPPDSAIPSINISMRVSFGTALSSAASAPYKSEQ